MKKGGFTLVELMGILVVMGILASVAIPGFSRWMPGYRLKGAARDLYSDMQLAKMEAARNNAECALIFDQANNSYQLVMGGQVQKTVQLSDYPGVTYGPGNAGQAFNVSRGFDNDITFEDSKEGADTVIFNPRGMINDQVHSAGEVYLTNTENSSYCVGATACGSIVIRKWDGTGWE